MKPFAFYSLLFVLGFSLSVAGFAAPPAGKKPRRGVVDTHMRFIYRAYDGGFSTVCEHRLESKNSPYDWKVECYEGEKRFATYSAHVALTQYRPTKERKLSIELLYWLMGTHLPSEVGSTTWFHFGEWSPLMEISTSQNVERGTAGLYLEIKPDSGFQSYLR